jgi:hypothetical protein
MPVQLPVAILRQYCNPFLGDPWGCGRIDPETVRLAVVARQFRDTPAVRADEAGIPIFRPLRSYEAHLRRIAYFVVHGWNDAIEVDIGIPSLRCHVDWIVQDGNHRLAAAIIRGDEFILASVGGCLDTALQMFGVDCAETAFMETT